MNATEGLIPEAVLPTPTSTPGLLALLEVLDRSGATLQSLPVVRWPVTVGRALTSDLVLTDAHVAAEHLRIEAPQAAAEPAQAADAATGPVVVQVLGTINGVRHAHTRHKRGERFDWTGHDELVLGRLRLRLHLAGETLAPEQVLARFRWRSIAATTTLLLAFVALGLWQTWLGNTELSRLAPNAGKMVGILVGFALIWAGVAALVSKLFAGHLYFWRHMRIVLGVSVVSTLLTGLLSSSAFAFGWVPLARLAGQLDWWAIGAGLLLQWWVIAPPRRRWLQASVVVGLLVLGAGVTAWLDNKDNQGEPRLAKLYPPEWRVATPVPVSQWLQESQVLRQRLDARLQDGDEDEATDANDDSDDEE